jgi:quercetin dioxygenase-like cupin family protein
MNLKDMIGGWFVGDFEPSVLKTKDFEVGVKKYAAGDKEDRHVHKVATEFTVIVSGKVKMNSVVHSEGDIVTIDPNVSTDFEALEDTVTIVVKTPSVSGDKYIL